MKPTDKQLMQFNNNNNKKKTVKKWVEDLNRLFYKKVYRWPRNTWKDTRHH